MKKDKTITSWLFTPFKFIAGAKALLFGILVMLLLSVLGYISNTHFDGALDIHYGCPDTGNSYINHFLYQLTGWGLLTLIFYVTAYLVTKSSIRLIDIAGTMALSQAPLIFAALLGFIPPFHICFGDVNTTNLADITAMMQDNIITIIICGLFTTLFVIWSVVLKYNAYSVSANVKGAIGVISFIAALLIAEVLSKLILYAIL